MVLKPFMLRRTKQLVEKELGEKVEKEILCGLAPRQNMMLVAALAPSSNPLQKRKKNKLERRLK